MEVTAFLLMAMASVQLSKGEDSVIVITQLGKISGFKEQSTKGSSFYSFHSIPYAQPPIGWLRLKDPVPSESWSDIRDGLVKPSECPQIPFMAATMRNPVFTGDEDCLYLSIFTSKPNEEDAKLPVMVFIHGGAYFSGGITNYSPYVLMNEEVVFVLIQYRLGILGFLSTEDDVIPGNFGLKDQILALQWIQENIHSFGGDKNLVTIFGESAGGSSVHFHILSPYSKGLFSRGIMQSGTLLCPWATGGSFREVAMSTGKRFNCLGIDTPGEQSSENLLKCLQEADVVNITLGLMDHIKWVSSPVVLAPRVDGKYLPEEPEVLLKEGRYNKVQIISGVNSNEGGLSVLPLFSYQAIRDDLLNNFKEMGPASMDIKDEASPAELAQLLFDHYVGGIKAGAEDAENLCKMYGDRQFTLGHDLFAKYHIKSTSDVPVYLYELNHRGQRSLSEHYSTNIGATWVTHVDDLYYLFTGGKTIWRALERDEDLRLRDILVKLWYNFALRGNPTPDDSLGFIWEPATEDHFGHLSLTPSPFMEKDKRQEVRRFLESLPTKQNYILHPDSVLAEQLQSLRTENSGIKDIETQREYKAKSEL